jgi:hypothetical protein
MPRQQKNTTKSLIGRRVTAFGRILDAERQQVRTLRLSGAYFQCISDH